MLVVLATLLGPGAFGTVAIATLFVLLFQQLFQQGIAPALISEQELTQRTLNIAFRIVVLLSFLSVAIVLACSRVVGLLFDNSGLPNILLALSPLLVLSGLELVPEARLRRKSEFRSLAIRSNVSSLVGGAIGIGAALGGLGVWALVLQQLSTGVISLVLLQLARPWWPSRLDGGLRGNLNEVRRLMSYGARLSLASTAQFLNQNIDSLAVGLTLGTTAVGIYRLAARLAATVVDVLLRSLQLSMLPDFARCRREGLPALAARVQSAQRPVVLVTLIPLGLLFGCAPLVPEALGAAWAPAVPVLRLLCLAGAASLLGAACAPALQAAGRPGALAGLNIIMLVGGTFGASLVALLAGAGGEADAWTLNAFATSRLVVSATLGLVVSAVILRRHVGVSIRAFFGASRKGLFVFLLTSSATTLLVALNEDRHWGIAGALALMIGGTVAILSALPEMCAKRSLAAPRPRRGEAAPQPQDGDGGRSV